MLYALLYYFVQAASFVVFIKKGGGRGTESKDKHLTVKKKHVEERDRIKGEVRHQETREVRQI